MTRNVLLFCMANLERPQYFQVHILSFSGNDICLYESDYVRSIKWQLSFCVRLDIASLSTAVHEIHNSSRTAFAYLHVFVNGTTNIEASGMIDIPTAKPTNVMHFALYMYAICTWIMQYAHLRTPRDNNFIVLAAKI